jgi:hypothetical protein
LQEEQQGAGLKIDLDLRALAFQSEIDHCAAGRRRFGFTTTRLPPLGPVASLGRAAVN